MQDCYIRTATDKHFSPCTLSNSSYLVLLPFLIVEIVRSLEPNGYIVNLPPPHTGGELRLWTVEAHLIFHA